MLITTYAEAVAFLDARAGSGIKLGLERVADLLDLMGNPQAEYPIIHVAGTNGKTTAARMISDILGAHGLRVGTYTSPHLNRVEERFTLAGRPLAEDEFTGAVADVAPFVTIYEERAGESVTYFELTTVIALAAFAAAAVDVAVLEVGLGGRWDATNVVEASVSVITGIAMDHMEMLGDTLPAIAAEKAAILKSGGLLVTGELPAAAEGSVTAQVAETGSRWIRYGTDYRMASIDQAVGGWLVDLEGVFGEYPAIYLPLHGRHQAFHLLTAVVAAEALFQRALDRDALLIAAEGVTSPGRLEIVKRKPLVLLDGAHNAEGLAGLARALGDEFPPGPWTLVVGMRGDRNPEELLEPLAGLVGSVYATAPEDEAAIASGAIAAAARKVFGEGVAVSEVGDVPTALSTAIESAGADGRVVVAGSLYVVGEARAVLLPRGMALPSGVHVRIEAEVDEGDEPDDPDDFYDDVEDDPDHDDYGSDLL